jgi:hypothetical protein
MTTRDPVTPTESLDDASDALATAAALGMNVPAPAGTYAYKLIVWYDDDVPEEEFIGLYATRNDTTNALANWILDRWKTRRYRPWLRDRVQDNESKEQYLVDFAAWLNEQTTQGVIALWKDINGKYAIADIDTLPIQTCPRSNAGKGNADE